MADPVITTGRSREEVAYDMARLILIAMEERKWKEVKRAEFLQTVYECVTVLGGTPPVGK